MFVCSSIDLNWNVLTLQNFNVSVKEHGAKALWALAGSTTTQQKYIAEKTSIPDICSMLLEDTEKLLQVGQYT
jgi:hypothetical protein